jgi:CRP/FNR family transcriptional regulator, cyclic AMP receptor protein
MEAALPIDREADRCADAVLGRRPSGATVALLTALDFDGALPHSVRSAARMWLQANAPLVSEGRWDGPAAGKSTVAHVVTEGFLLATTEIQGATAAEVLGPGDVICTDGENGGAALAERSRTWTALTPARILAFDEQRFGRAMCSPDVIRALVCATDRRTRRMAGNHAIASVPRIEHRVLSALWQLADEWGRVTPDGITIPIPLTHYALAKIVGCERPSMTGSLGQLRDRGWVQRRERRTWMLAHHAPRPPIE